MKAKYIFLFLVLVSLVSCRSDVCDYSKGQFLYERGQYTKAAKIVTNAILECGGSTDSYLLLGNIYEGSGDYYPAIYSYSKALSYDSANIDASIDIVKTLVRVEHTEQAIEWAKKCVQTNSDSARAYNNLGYAYDAYGNPDEAMYSFELAVQYDPEYAEAYRNLGAMSLRAGDYSRAIEKLDMSLFLNPNDALSLSMFGQCCILSGDTLSAENAFRKSVKYGRNNSDIMFNAGYFFETVGNYSMSKACYTQSARLGSKDASEKLESKDLKSNRIYKK